MGLLDTIGAAAQSALGNVKDGFEDNLNYVSGNIPKACLYVRDITEKSLGTEQNQAQSLIEAVREGWEVIKSLQDGGTGNLSANHYRKLEVQYNPSSLTLKTAAGKSVRPMGGDMGGANANQIVQVINPVATELCCEIIIDDMNVFDAFAADGVNVLTAGGISSMTQAIKKRKDEKSYSVQDAAEALLALVLTTETRQVIFAWSTMFFRGEVTNTNVRFTMFNKRGNPIRAVIELTIRQGDEFEADEKLWEKAFDKAFGDDHSEDMMNESEEANWYEQILNIRL